MQGEASYIRHKLVQYNSTIYEIPIRVIDGENVVLLSDLQSIIPEATAFMINSKLIPFQLHPEDHTELLPKRVTVEDASNISICWDVHVPSNSEYQGDALLLQKINQLSDKLDHLLSLQQPDTVKATTTAGEIAATESHVETSRHIENENGLDQQQYGSLQPTITESSSSNSSNSSREHMPRSSSPPPAFSTSSHVQPNASSSSSVSNQQVQHEAPPSYETSVLSTIKALNTKLRLYESHISNRHKSPKWLAKRDEWVSREPNSIEQVAFQLVQLEMALLWTAVTESWIQERETWLTLVASSRSERHLAGAIINLERHTLVMDEDWSSIRERWINDLLEMVVLPLSHG